jgi:hypothetical protein
MRKFITTIALLAVVDTSVAIAQTAGSRSDLATVLRGATEVSNFRDHAKEALAKDADLSSSRANDGLRWNKSTNRMVLPAPADQLPAPAD